jgi:branched-chain amino acid transport system ATP-binding protein
LLKVENLSVFYGGIHALKGISIDVQEGQIVSIIGSNGAGKSTLLNTISGIVKPKEGRIKYKGRDLPRLPHRIVKEGISQVPEGRLVFANLTVRENLMMGAYLRRDAKGIENDLRTVFKLFPRLEERINQVAGTLSGGEQQMLAMGRGLMSSPELVLLDEPSLGLAPLLVKTIFEIIEDIKSMNKTILLVEQNAYKALSVADKAYVLEQGRITMEGSARELLRDKSIQEAYLGRKQ